MKPLALLLWVLVALLAGLVPACQPLAAPKPPARAIEVSETLPTCAPGDRALAGQVSAAEEDRVAAEYPLATAVLWADGFLWTANESGLLTRWDVRGNSYVQHHVPDRSVIRALAGTDQIIYAGTDGGDIWWLSDGGWHSQRACAGAPVTAIALGRDGEMWCACREKGVVRLAIAGGATVHQVAVDDAHRDALQDVGALTFDPARDVLWVATHSAGLLSHDVREGTWYSHATLNAIRVGDVVNDLRLAPDGSLWLATPSGVSLCRGGAWENCQLTQEVSASDALSLAIAGDSTVWVAGGSYVARIEPGGTRQVYGDADNPVMADRHRFVALDDEGHPWFVGRRGKIHFDGQTWMAYDADVRRVAQFAPAAPVAAVSPPARRFPSPTSSYIAWLKTWPRPAGDNGRGMHFLQTHQYDAIEAQRQVNRLKQLGARWALVQYADHDQLVRTSPIFQAAGITVVWRPFVRPYQTYVSWAEDVAFLRSRGLAPYMQLYNEPSLAQEWDGVCPVSQETYLRNLLPAAQQVYGVGGYVGLQFTDPQWLRLTLQRMKAQGMSELFNRLFFVPHLHGLNHPPGYDEDINGVLGFWEFARVFAQEIGFVPAMIAGEGGWRPGEQQDSRFPAITEELHRDYHLAVLDWFRTGRLSNGDPLPDYLFAFCPWLVSDPVDPAAWFDGPSGNHQLTIEAVVSMPAFERKFSWDG